MTDFIELTRIVVEWTDESSLNKDEELASWLDDTQRLRKRYMVRHRFNVSNLILNTILLNNKFIKQSLNNSYFMMHL